jgi:L-fuculose-phosphate aldolase
MFGHVHESGRSLEDALPEDMIMVNFKGEVLEGKASPPEEKIIHTAIYSARSDVNSVVHAHPQYSTAFSTVERGILPITLGSTIFWRSVPILDIGASWVISEEHGKSLVEKLGDGNAVLLRGHGVVTAGRSLEEACSIAIALEKAARMQILASLAGTPIPFAREDAKKFAQIESISIIYQWGYYESRLKKQNVDEKLKD